MNTISPTEIFFKTTKLLVAYNFQYRIKNKFERVTIQKYQCLKTQHKFCSRSNPKQPNILPTQTLMPAED